MLADPSESPEGRGIAERPRASFWRSLPDDVLVGLQRDSAYSSFDELPGFIRDDLSAAVVEDAELIGFWGAWHRAGRFASLELGGWHRATIYRKIRRFRARFGAHPDVFRFSWISLDLERAWNEELKELQHPSAEPEGD